MNKIKVITNECLSVSSNDKYTITDKNGTTFDVTLNDIVNIEKYPLADNNDMLDSLEHLTNFTPNITDSDNNTMTDTELVSLIKDNKVNALEVVFEATHSGENLNNVLYTSSSMEQDSKTWMYPFSKPLIKNHDLNEEPIGRVKEAYFSQSEFCEDRDCINVVFRVSDYESMIKFADRRYQTMSIGATSGYIRCNVCGKDILKDSQVKFCGHWKGNVYAGKKATWTVERMDYREGSVVNNPADVFAQVKSIRAIKNVGGNSVDNKDTKSIEDIDNLLKDEVLEENQVEDSTQVDESPETIEKTEVVDSSEQTETVEELLVKLQESNDKVTELDNSIVELNKEIDELKSNLTILTNDNLTLKDESSDYKKQAVTMAKLNLNLLKDTLLILDTTLDISTLEDKTAKELSELITNKKEELSTRDSGEVLNPSLVSVNDKYVVSDEVKVQKTKIKDYEDEFLNIWNR